MQSLGPNELLEDVFRQDLCIGCGMCVDLCPYFKTYMGRTTQVFKCNLKNGRCYAYCPKTEVDLDALCRKLLGSAYEGTPIGRYQRIAVARAGEKAAKGNFQAGGTVSSIIAMALASEIIDCAVLTGRDGLVPVPMIVTDPKEVIKAAGSKFMASPTLSSLNRAIKQGYKNIGIVGTPCQMTAVAKRRFNATDTDASDPIGLTVGLFCTWAVDTRNLISTITKSLDTVHILGMDVPPPPAEIMVLETERGQVEIPLSIIRSLVPHGCHICPDMTSEWGDIAVGQAEGMPGWNTIIIRTEKGEQVFHQAIESGYLETGELSEDLVQALKRASATKKARAVKIAKEEGFLNTNTDFRPRLRIPSKAIEKISSNTISLNTI